MCPILQWVSLFFWVVFTDSITILILGMSVVENSIDGKKKDTFRNNNLKWCDIFYNLFFKTGYPYLLEWMVTLLECIDPNRRKIEKCINVIQLHVDFRHLQ